MATSGYVEALFQTMRTAGLEFTTTVSDHRGYRYHVLRNSELNLVIGVTERTSGKRIDIGGKAYYPAYNLATMLQHMLKLFGEAAHKEAKKRDTAYYESEMRDSPCGPAKWTSFSGHWAESVVAPGAFCRPLEDGIQVVFKTRDGETYRHLMRVLGDLLYMERQNADSAVDSES